MLPKPIYELLPVAYLILGLLSLLKASNLVGALSSGLLISAALMIFSARIRYRVKWPQY